MSHQATGSAHREDGTASVEMVAVVPFLLLAVLVAAQLGLAGYVLWSAGIAARAGARAELVGGDVEARARQALPASLRGGADVSSDGGVSVRLDVPRLIPGLPPLKVTARSALESGDG